MILIFNGCPIDKANKKGEVPGDGGKIEMKMFNRKVFGEKACFGQLPAHMISRMTDIFNDIDLNDEQRLDIEKCRNYNAWMMSKNGGKVNQNLAERDAIEFLNDCCWIEKAKDFVRKIFDCLNF